jgi:hypothetical protein
MSISIQYNLTGRGWAECVVEIDGQEAHLTASYLSDALADLLDAVTAVIRGVEESTASFAEEPGEYRWRLRRVSDERLCICIVWFEHLWKHRPDGEGEVVFEAECRLRTFAGAVLSASQRVLSTHGLEDYKEKWGHYGFPIEAQTKLKEAIGGQRGRTTLLERTPEIDL